MLTTTTSAQLHSHRQAQDKLSSATTLQEGFKNPGSESRPRVWWHWMNGNITKDGIRKDLQWMQRVGIGGVHNFDAGLRSPQIVQKRLEYMTPEWKDAYRYAVSLADSMGMEFTIASAPGWSAQGGPWVKPQQAMKKLTWREQTVVGKKKGGVQKIQLAEPFKKSGMFQDMISMDTETSLGGKTPPVADYYEDIAVLAVRHNKNAMDVTRLNPTLTTSGGEGFTIEALNDGSMMNVCHLNANPNGSYGWIEYSFNQPLTVRGIRLATDRRMGVFAGRHADTMGSLWVSDNGKDYRFVSDIHTSYVSQQTVSIPATTAKYFRLRIENPKPDMSMAMFGRIGEAAKFTNVPEFQLLTGATINHAEEKAGFNAVTDLTDFPTASNPSSFILNPSSSLTDVIDVTDKVDANGVLNWQVPEGEWTIYRFGWSLTGKQNHPASYEATGLEVDKLDGEAWTDYFHHYFDMYSEAAGGLMGQHGIQYVLTDSYEAGQETWTPKMMQEFEKRRGYKLLPWLPVLTGRVIGSVAQSEQFLHDWRQTISDLIAENFDRLTTIAQKDYGMKGRYSESHEGGRAFIVDGMDVKRTATVPMAAMWTYPLNDAPQYNYRSDIMESASVSHIYGQNLVEAESMTATGYPANSYCFHPANLKHVIDAELAAGLNRVVVHCSPHQPVDDKKPGLSLMVFGQWFTRHETWAEQAKSWMDYIARSSYMLQQGHFVADVLWYYGEDSNVSSLYNQKDPDVPKGYAWDYCSPHALLNEIDATDKNITTKSGMKYQVLVLDANVKYMSLPVLRKIKELADAGIIICGSMPEQPAGQKDDCTEWYDLVDQIWHTDRANVSTGKAVGDVLNGMHIQPDFSVEKGYAMTLPYVHRTLSSQLSSLSSQEIYWIQNPTTQALTLNASFRTTGKKPYIWHPEDGRMEEASYSMVNGRTEVVIPMVSEDALFVVFQEPTDQQSLTLPEKEIRTLMEINTPWNVRFLSPSKDGTPAEITMDHLTPLNENSDASVRYFSGTATYKTTINVDKKQIKDGQQYILDLGEVGVLAEVIVNGQNMGTAWKAPYELDVTSALKAGKNTLEIRVTNDWRNRIIGDAQPDCKEKCSYTVLPFYQANTPLQPSGLMSTVKIKTSEK